MRILTIIVLFIFFSCSGHKTDNANKFISVDTIQTKNDPFVINCTPPNVERLIVRSDTTFRMENYDGHRIKSFDSKGRLVRFIRANLFESNSNNIYSFTTFYDSVGHVIYEDKVKGFNSKWHCYCFQYDELGQLIMKSGYSSGEIGIKVTYVYKDDKLVNEIIERADGKKEIQH